MKSEEIEIESENENNQCVERNNGEMKIMAERKPKLKSVKKLSASYRKKRHRKGKKYGSVKIESENESYLASENAKMAIMKAKKMKSVKTGVKTRNEEEEMAKMTAVKSL
jgi:hypothetical protein